MCLCFCSGTDMSAIVSPIGVKFCALVDLCPERGFCHFGGDISSGLQMWGQEMGRDRFSGL